MVSDESDDEPLSLLATKKSNQNSQEEPITESSDDEPKKKKKKIPTKKFGVTIKINRKLNTIVGRPVIERPADVWLYLKDLNSTGPYSCLLCSDWFINRSKMVLHYALNHKKDFCGICRYFVPDRESWWEHEKFHSPWPCSQCVETFASDNLLRNHLSTVHNLVHCRLCHFRVTGKDDYNSHLFQKHNVTNVSCQNEDKFWELDYEGDDKFLCLLCSKTDILSSALFGHFMGFHHFTLKCLTSLIAGKNTSFTVDGAEVTERFVEEQLKDRGRLGYVDLGPKTFDNQESGNEENKNVKSMEIILPEIKQENTSSEMDSSKKEVEMTGNNNSQNDELLDYKGEEDFDVTLTEFIVLEKSYYEYINQMLIEINGRRIPQISHIDYDKVNLDALIDIDCDLCKCKLDSIQNFTSHLIKMHSVKTEPEYFCRVCSTTFETHIELTTHIKDELAEFKDLWICQFCDKEFDNRETTRNHLTEHWANVDYENCFSPHIGFKCKYCATLFWNEPDREVHQLRVHFNKYKDQFYKCETCNKTFGDKVWYIHHHLENHSTEDQKMYLVKCCLCCVVVTSVDEMRKHFEDKHPEVRKLYCSLDSCLYKPLSHRKSFKLHVKMIHCQQKPDTRKPVSCNFCQREFASARACSAHTAQVHGPGKFKCKLCNEMLQTIDERKLHYLLRHPGHHPFECVDCGKSFQYKSSLYMHRQDHQPNKQNFTCSYCGKIFAKKDSFREHVQIHEGPRHACSYCPMRFVQRSNMLRHERRHTGERPYRCEHCPRSFADKGACTAHTRTHSKESSYACLYCGQTFVQKSKLTYHIRKHTGENLESCSVCSKLFTSACSLREHMKTHVEKKQIVKCPLCEKGYQDERYMLRHLRTSHTRAQFSCPLCHKLLTSAAGLRHHVITHSPINTFICKCCPKSYAVKRTIVKHLRKRHGLKGNELNIKDYFTRLEPRKCQLNLDEETMDSIFGPPKRSIPDVLISDFVTFTNNFPIPEGVGNNTDTEDENDNTETKESDHDNDSDSDGPQGSIKQEPFSGDELEPTDFVSIKIEPADDEDSE